MRSQGGRIAIGLATLAAVVVLFVVFAGGDDDSNSSTTTTQAQTTPAAEAPAEPAPEPVAVDEQISVRNGKPVGGVKKLTYDSGDRIRFVVTSDVADEIHVHGYDITKDVKAGSSVRFRFPAKLEGVFEVELHDREQQIAELRVSP